VEGLLLREVEAARLTLLPPLQSLDARVGWVLDHLAAAGTRG
jgi:hypothetical protein